MKCEQLTSTTGLPNRLGKHIPRLDTLAVKKKKKEASILFCILSIFVNKQSY
jgi:hypothetical protein